MDGGGWAREKKNLHEDSEGAVCEGERPETASRLAGTPSTAEARRTVQPAAARGAQFARLSRRAAEVATPGTAFATAVAAAAEPSGQIPPPAPPAQSILIKRRRFLGEARDGEGESKPSGALDRCLGGEGGAVRGRMRRAGRCCPFKRRRRSPDLFSFPGRRGSAAGRARWGGAALGVGRRGARKHPSLPASLRSTGLPAQIRHRAGIEVDCAAKGARPGPAVGQGVRGGGAATRGRAGRRRDPRTSERT